MKSSQLVFASAVVTTALTLSGARAATAQVFVTDFNGNAGISEFSFNGTFLRTFVAGGSGGLSAPSNLTWGPDGNLYVASSGNGSIKKYDGGTGAFLGNVATGFSTPYDLAFGPDGNLYVPDYSTSTVYKVNSATGVTLQTYTSGVSRPEGIAFLSNGNFVVGSGNGANPVEFNANTGTSFTFATGVGVNVGLATGPDGRMYFTQFSNGTIAAVPAAGGAATTFSTGGSLFHPQYIAYGNGSFFVASLSNNTVQYFSATTGAFQGSFASTGAAGIAIRGSAAAPEPGTFALALLSGPLLFGLRRRTSRSRKA